jgi:hypothetical protein
MVQVPGVNLDNVEGQFEDLTVEGVANAVVQGATMSKSQSGNDTLIFKCKCLTGADAGKVFGAIFSLQPNALWKLRTFRDACGVQSQGDMIDTDGYVDARFAFAAGNEAFTGKDGKATSRIKPQDFMAYDERIA